MDDTLRMDLKASYGITANNISAMDGGWLNQLWKISANGCDLVVKQYSMKRFNRQKLQTMEDALQRQAMLERCGVACPHLYPCNGRMIRIPDDKTAYVVMKFCEGEKESPQTITLSQVKHLGGACAHLHKAFGELPISVKEEFPELGGYTLEALRGVFRARMESLSPLMPYNYQKALHLSCTIIDSLSADLFDRLPKGMAHEDFTPDNLLFDAHGVSAVIDFDRSCYSYPWHDVGRAILSFALETDGLNLQKVRAFLDGYSQYMPLTMRNAADALRITWCVEMPWWIHPDCFTAQLTGKAVAYRDQILWLAGHWTELDTLLPAT